ncbi:acyltransferase family protein [Tsukamurella conjunctivitidis]|uniref:Acyltransferase n=2 Tax=Tsukamurella TaxID=2060 RepID=A0A5C5RY64_9ACTN|nr:acyltransferase [Tsukamurella conjunctivitidis]NMD56724.1 acyltransferase [Tsukamurella columbiensis]TWS27380.1 acyltransferase [Tsukamurella conjunctivitidis]
MSTVGTSDFASAKPAGAAGFVPALEGMRACAAIAVMLTHTAFQTGQVGYSVVGRVWGRFDMAVALFFGLSGFLLWRAHARAAWSSSDGPPTGRYYRSRFVRIMPAYLVVAVVALALLPRSTAPSGSTWLANLTLTQVFVPYSLTDGLTQMWSLSVEMLFYLLLPPAALMLVRLRGPAARWRVPVLLVVAAVSLSWAWVGAALPLPPGVNHHNWLPSYVPWFVAGIVLAEIVSAPVTRYGAVRRLAQRRVCWPAALVVFAVICTPLGGPVTLDSPESWQFAVRMGLGGVLGFLLLAPLVLAPASAPARWLGSGPMLALGRWSYGIFIWHLVVLTAIFPLFAIVPFHGNMLKVTVLTLVFSVAVAALSYAWVEEPARRWLARREARRSATAGESAPSPEPTRIEPPEPVAPVG